MAIPQSTLEEIIESERNLAATASARYGRFYLHARECSVFLSRSIVSIDHDRMMFARFFSHLKKHHMLALLSAARLHKVQAMMNLRQVLEAGASAAFAIANPEPRHFIRQGAGGAVEPTQELTSKRYKWLADNYIKGSDAIKDRKNLINLSTAHANAISASSVFAIADSGDWVDAPFFDYEDDYHVKTDLWQIGSVALTLMELFDGVNVIHNALGFVDRFEGTLRHVAAESETLRAEMMRGERFQAAAAKLA